MVCEKQCTVPTIRQQKKGFFIFCLPFRTLFTLSPKGKLSSHSFWKLYWVYSPASNLKLSSGKVGMSAWGQGIYIRPCCLPPPPHVCTCMSVPLSACLYLSVSGFCSESGMHFHSHSTHTLSSPPHTLIPFSLIFLSNHFLFLPFNQKALFSSFLSLSKFTSQQIVLQ